MMKSTREQVIDLLRQHGELTAADLGERLGIATPAVRRHLDILAGEGLVAYRAVRQHTGRPYFAYSLTEAGKERESTGYSRLVERLLREVSTIDDGSGTGQRLLETVLERMSEHLAEEHRGRVRGATLEERAASLVGTLAEEGLLDRVEVRDDGVHLMNSCCPYRRAAMANSAICRSEQHTIALLLDADVDQVSRIADGRPCCEYVVHAPGAAAPVA